MPINESNLSWYHENLSRCDAEDLLMQEGNSEDGVFLVRNSSTAPGDYVLSVLQNGAVVHWQIRRHGEDAFFSIDCNMIMHGLETLIEVYQSKDYGIVKLSRPIAGTAPPPKTRRHGYSNLLHRSTKEGELNVVSEMLKCGYRTDAKNQYGQTAVHIACAFARNDILLMLIEHHADVNCRDSGGYTPLHYACWNNFSQTVNLLVEQGSANMQIRNTNTGWVPLHEAAAQGYIDVMETLLSHGAPVRPRTPEGHTPADIAQINKHTACVNFLETFKSPEPQTTKDLWYHGTLGRKDAVDMLSHAGNKNGSFLVRHSDRNSKQILTMVHENEHYHFQVNRDGAFYYIDDGPLLDSLEHIVEHYSLMPDGLPTTLQNPIRPVPKPPLPPPISEKFARTLPSKHRRNGRDRQSSNSVNNTSTLPLPVRNKKSIMSNLRPDANMNTAPLPLPRPRKLRNDNIEESIPYENLILKEVLGEGEFGSVYKAIYQNKLGFEEEVAVKKLHEDQVIQIREQFLREIKVMVGLNHHCIVRLIGVSNGPSLVMVQELAPLGSMLKYLIIHKKTISESDLKLWAWQIACGMQYLTKQKCVHRDLAARNILLATKYQVKVSDFGLSRLYNERDHYRATQAGRWPIKWYAPESVHNARFTSASDVWSYGVTLWEMFSYGQMPYGDLSGHQAITLIDEGERLERPENCSGDVYRTMESCWFYNERDRPTFDQLVEIFTDNNYINIKELVPETDIC